jgi:hypothetical protein
VIVNKNTIQSCCDEDYCEKIVLIVNRSATDMFPYVIYSCESDIKEKRKFVPSNLE